MNDEIVLVGPTLPYRGGISQYNTCLFRQLRQLGLATVGYSFSRQYPAWLYPGESDLDPDHKDHVEPGIEYSIDSLNPLSWLQTARAIASRRPRLVVFHWWTIFWLPCFLVMWFLLHRKGLRIGLICHNLVDHDASFLKRWLARIALSRSDAYLVHSSEHARILTEVFPRIPTVLHTIPVYSHYPEPVGFLEKRGRLELLFFGFIRPYKGLELLIEALTRLDDHEVYLTVVGEHWGNSEELQRLAAAAPNVELHLQYSSDAEAAEYFDRADVVVLPYRSATGSAVAATALHYEKPMIATRTGGLPDVVVDGQTGVLISPSSVDELMESLRCMTRAEAERLSLNIEDFKRRHDWASMARAVSELGSNTLAPFQDGATKI